MSQRQKLLSDLGKVAQDLKTWLHENPKMDMIDQLYIENHIELIRFSYSAWKSKQVQGKNGQHRL